MSEPFKELGLGRGPETGRRMFQKRETSTKPGKGIELFIFEGQRKVRMTGDG